jgi:hypothetical protein
MARTRRLGSLAFAHGVPASAINVWHLFHRFALDTAVLARRCDAGTDWMCTLLSFFRTHFYSPSFGTPGIAHLAPMDAPALAR